MKGIITMVTDHQGNKKHEKIIGKEVEFDRQRIYIGVHGIMEYKNDDGQSKTVITTRIQKVHEDSYGITIYTKNSVYHIEK